MTMITRMESAHAVAGRRSGSEGMRVSAVVIAHGGKVQVKETTGGGATFEVELPLAATGAN